MKTLIAEDDRELRETLSFLLRFEGYDVVEAANGIEAWHEFERSRFTLVLSDWMMPQLDGLVLGAGLQPPSTFEFEDCPILTTQHGDEGICGPVIS